MPRQGQAGTSVIMGALDSMREEFQRTHKDLKEDLTRIDGRVARLEHNVASKDDHKDHEDRLRKLEQFKERIVGVLILGSVCGGGLVAGAVELIRRIH